MATFAYKLMYRGEPRTEGVAFDQPHESADEFAAAFGALLERDDSRPLPYPVELHVWVGENTGRRPDAVHVRRRRVRGRQLEAVAS